MDERSAAQSHPAPRIEALALPGCDAPLPVVRDSSGQGWLVLKPACEALGIDPRAQQKRLARHSWAVTSMMAATATDGKRYDMLALRADRVAMWLATIEGPRLQDPAITIRVQKWQHEAADVLDRWVRGALPALQPQQPDRVDRLADAVAQLAQTVGLVLSKLAAPAVPAPAPAVALPAPSASDEWLTIEELCAVLGYSSRHLYKEIERAGGFRAIERKNGGRSSKGGRSRKLWNVATVRAVLAGQIPPRRWEPPAPALPAQVGTQKELRRHIVERVRFLAKLKGCEHGDDFRANYQGIYREFTRITDFDPLSDARGKETMLEVIERHEKMPTLLNVVETEIRKTHALLAAPVEHSA